MDRLVYDESIGRLVIRNTRVPVDDVIEALQTGLSVEQILADWYPVLTREDIEACLAWWVSQTASRNRVGTVIAG